MENQQVHAVAAKPEQAGQPGRERGRRDFRGRPRHDDRDKEFDQRILEMARVTRVTKGGKRMRFRACVIIGDRRGRVGFAVAKGADVSASVNKAALKAKKKLITVPMVKGTIPHVVSQKFAAASLLIKPAPMGTGIKAGGALRVVLELAGVPNVVGKLMGSKNKINNTKAAIMALKKLKAPAVKQAAPAVEPAKVE